MQDPRPEAQPWIHTLTFVFKARTQDSDREGSGERGKGEAHQDPGLGWGVRKTETGSHRHERPQTRFILRPSAWTGSLSCFARAQACPWCPRGCGKLSGDIVERAFLAEPRAADSGPGLWLELSEPVFVPGAVGTALSPLRGEAQIGPCV